MRDVFLWIVKVVVMKGQIKSEPVWRIGTGILWQASPPRVRSAGIKGWVLKGRDVGKRSILSKVYEPLVALPCEEITFATVGLDTSGSVDG